jgi:hypothetical protein
MGNSAVAVLHYDMLHEIERASKRMADAMLAMPGSEKPQRFGFGSIVSWDHADGYQVCVIHGNTGWRIGPDNDVPEDVLKAAVDMLKWRGYKITPPQKKQGDRTVFAPRNTSVEP